jgi:hypothetical protein
MDFSDEAKGKASLECKVQFQTLVRVIAVKATEMTA